MSRLPGVPVRALFTALLLGGAGANLGWAQYIVNGVGLSLRAQNQTPQAATLWLASKGESYHVTRVLSRLRALSEAALIYSFDHQDKLPPTAMTLYTTGFITDPNGFYNPGDVDPLPSTIDNDVPNALNSARISFDFPGAGQPANFSNTQVMFSDNSVANNGGLGLCTVFMDTHTEFVIPSPRPAMTPVRVSLQPHTPAQLQFFNPSSQQPYAFDLPAGTIVEQHVAPHMAQFDVATVYGPSLRAVFAAQGYAQSNSASTTAQSQLAFPEVKLLGPAGPAQPVTAYVTFQAVVTRDGTTPGGVASFHTQLQTTANGTTTNSLAFCVLTDTGFLWTPAFVPLEITPVTPDSPDYVPGKESWSVIGRAQLTVPLPIGVDGILTLTRIATASFGVDPNTPDGTYTRVRATIQNPINAAVTRVKLYAPRGYSFSVTPITGPADLLETALRGDYDGDSDVDGFDRNALAAAYTRPLVSKQFNAAPPLVAPETFDFDGDGDVDCADDAAFNVAWTAVNPAGPIPPCAGDGDGDGIADGDDDCPDTAPGVAVDARGCPQGDYDGDGAVAASDLDGLATCLGGPTAPGATLFNVTPACANAFDHDLDRDIDLHDVAVWQRAFE